MPPPPPNLSDDLLGEVFLRLPPDDHECLLHASLACKRWRRVIADPAFRRRHWDLHGTLSAVGSLRIAGDVAYIHDPDSCRHTVRSQGRALLLAPRRMCLPGRRVVLDCRRGRFLFCMPSPLLGTNVNYDLVVWDRRAKEQRCLPRLSPPVTNGRYFNAAVLCSVAGCNHSKCQGGSFRVAIIWSHEHIVYARVYSLKTDNWSDAISFQRPRFNKYFGMMPCRNTLVGDTLYFHNYEYAWEYQLGAQRLSMIRGPKSTFLVMPTRNGGLGCMNIEKDKSSLRLQLWSREAAPNSEQVARWTRDRAIDLGELLALASLTSWSVELLAFAEGTDAVFVGTVSRNPHAVYMVELNSRRARKVSEFDRFTPVFPYTSFCIPVIDASSTTGGPGRDASGA